MDTPRIYFVYEIDEHRSWNTMAVKGIFLNPENAVTAYDAIKRNWWPYGEGYLLVLGYLEESEKAIPHEDYMREMNEICATDNEDEEE